MQVDPPEDHIIVIAQIVHLDVPPAKLKSDGIHWNVDQKTEGHTLAQLKVIKILSVDSWDPSQAKKFKEVLFAIVPGKGLKVGSELKVYVTDAKHYGWDTPREISTSTVPPFWVPPKK